MDEFIKLAASQLGIGEAESRSATTGILNMIKEKLGEADVSEILSELPGADALVSQSGESAAQESGDGLGGLLGKATSMLGGGGDAANIASMLGSSGLSLDKAGPFVAMFVSFLQGKLGGDLLDKIKGAIPDLIPGD